MAETALSSLLEQLTLIIIQEADQLRTVQDDVIEIERELQSLAAMVEAYELPNQIPNKQLKKYKKEIRDLILQTTGLVRTYATIVSERATEGIHKRPINLLKERKTGKKLRRIRIEIADAKERLLRFPGLAKEEDLLKRGDQSQVPKKDPARPSPVEVPKEARIPSSVEVPKEARRPVEVPKEESRPSPVEVPKVATRPSPVRVPKKAVTRPSPVQVPTKPSEEEHLAANQSHTPYERNVGTGEKSSQIGNFAETEIGDQKIFWRPSGSVLLSGLCSLPQIHIQRFAADEHLPATCDQSNVPNELRRLIFYFLLFPNGFEIPTRRLLALWAAEGLIGPIDGQDRWNENIASENLNSLERHGLVLFKKKKLNGKVQICQLKDGIRETWLMEAKKANFFENHEGSTLRVVDHTTDAGGDSFIRIHGNPTIADSVPKYGDIFSFMSFDAKEGSKAGEDIGDFLDKCILGQRFLRLKVLDLERVFRPKLPKTLGKLIRLKYLGLRWTYLEQLPVFVNKLLELQVLDVKHTYISVLPKSIWRMKDLRHLYLSEVYRTRFPDWPRGSSSCLKVLRTLWGAFVDEDTRVKDGLDTLVDIRKLGLACGPKSLSSQPSDMSKQLEAVNNWISNLKFLECLRLKSRDRQGKAADLYLTTLSENTNLSTVYLLGKLKLNPSVVHEFPASLTDVTLSGSELDMDPMEFLGSLPKLQILRLLAQSVVYPRIRFSEGSFLQLKVLYIWKLDNLEEWEVERGAVPRLEELEIRSCEKLTRLPNELQNVNELRKLRLTNMPERFTYQTRAEQPQLWAKIDHGEDEQQV